MEQYLASGVHIGTRQKTGDMAPYVYRVRSDGLFVLDVRQADERIAAAAKLIASYDPEEVYIVSVRQYGQRPVSKFGKATGVKTNAGRFIPGTLTNPSYEGYVEPKLIMITDPVADEQALAEASKVGTPVIGICDTDNKTKNIDLVIPANNRGRKALALIYWLLAERVLKERGDLDEDEEWGVSLEEFETKFSEEE
ncbi:MAG: 30S ribosomal protein S2 [Candidatus Hadarchaeia archaeon]